MILGIFTATITVVLVVVLVVIARRVTRRLREARLRDLSSRHRPLLLALVAGDPEDAREAAVAIAALDRADWRILEPAVVGVLAKVRGEGRDEVVRLLHERGVIARARRDLHRRGAVRRATAADLLGRAQAPGSVRALARLLDDRDRDVRQVAARALGRLGAPAAVPPLLAALACEPPRVPPATVAHALLRIGPDGVPALGAALDHPAPTVRAAAVVVLGRLGATGAGPALAARLRTDDVVDVRCLAATALGALGLPRAVPDLVAATSATSPAALRIAATRALGDLGDTSTAPLLYGLLTDDDARVAAEAGPALLALGESRSEVLRRSVPHVPAGRHVPDLADPPLRSAPTTLVRAA